MCPIGVDQTERTAQQWWLLAPRLKEIHPLSSREFIRFRFDSTTPMQFLSSNISWNSWSKLARPALPRHLLSSAHKTPSSRKSNLRSSSKKELAPLERIPAELLALIVDSDVLEREDIIALGLSSQHLWPHALEHINKACYKATALWANTPIACTGTHLAQLPPSFAAENPEPSPTHSNETQTWWFQNRMCWARRFNWDTKREYTPVQTRGSESDGWMAALSKHLQTAQFSAGFASQLERDVACEPVLLPPASSQCALRNLTMREYVRCLAPVVRDQAAAYVEGSDATLDQVLLMRICWSAKRFPPAPDAHPDIFERGVWAGHCFDVVALQEKTLSAADGENAWRDVTEEVVEQFRGLSGRLVSKRRFPMFEDVSVEESSLKKAKIL